MEHWALNEPKLRTSLLFRLVVHFSNSSSVPPPRYGRARILHLFLLPVCTALYHHPPVEPS